jgi:hypothetical protein
MELRYIHPVLAVWAQSGLFSTSPSIHRPYIFGRPGGLLGGNILFDGS